MSNLVLNWKKYSRLEATRSILIYLLSCLFALSCKQAVSHNEEAASSAKSAIDSASTLADTILDSSQNNFIDSLPEGFEDLLAIDSSILLDIPYATDSNFTGLNLYPCARCLLKQVVAKKLASVNMELIKKGVKLKVLDCYRPLDVQKKLWQSNPDPRFVMSPSRGSGHTRGTAVDVTLVSVDDKELDMGSKYDEFSEKAYYNYVGISNEVKRLRWLLRKTMRDQGFYPLNTEWWHFQYGFRRQEPVMNFSWKCKPQSI